MSNTLEINHSESAKNPTLAVNKRKQNQDSNEEDHQSRPNDQHKTSHHSFERCAKPIVANPRSAGAARPSSYCAMRDGCSLAKWTDTTRSRRASRRTHTQSAIVPKSSNPCHTRRLTKHSARSRPPDPGGQIGLKADRASPGQYSTFLGKVERVGLQLRRVEESDNIGLLPQNKASPININHFARNPRSKAWKIKYKTPIPHLCPALRCRTAWSFFVSPSL